MTEHPIKLSATARAMLTLAATREDRLVRPPQLPVAAARQVVRSLLNNGFVEEVPAPTDDPAYVWREIADGTKLALRATGLGLTAIGDAAHAPVITGNEDQPAEGTVTEPDAARVAESHPVAGSLDANSQREEEPPTAQDRADGEPAAPDSVADAGAAEGVRMATTAPANLRQAAQAVLDAWNGEANRETDPAEALRGPMAILEAALAGRAPRPVSGAPRKPREGTKQELVLAMLRREEGASGPQIAEATGWASHSVRGFLAGLKKKGIRVEALDRVRAAGPDKAGAKGAFTIYRVTARPEA